MAAAAPDFPHAHSPAFPAPLIVQALPLLRDRNPQHPTALLRDLHGNTQTFRTPNTARVLGRAQCRVLISGDEVLRVFRDDAYAHTVYAGHTENLAHAVASLPDDGSPAPIPPVILQIMGRSADGALQARHSATLARLDLSGAHQGAEALRQYFEPGSYIALSGCSAQYRGGELVLLTGATGTALPCVRPYWDEREIEFAPGPHIWEAAEALCLRCAQGARFEELRPQAELLWHLRQKEDSGPFYAQDPEALRWWFGTSPAMRRERELSRGATPETRAIFWLRRNHHSAAWKIARRIALQHGELPLATLHGVAPDPARGIDLWRLPGGEPRFAPARESYLRGVLEVDGASTQDLQDAAAELFSTAGIA